MYFSWKKHCTMAMSYLPSHNLRSVIKPVGLPHKVKIQHVHILTVFSEKRAYFKYCVFTLSNDYCMFTTTFQQKGVHVNYLRSLSKYLSNDLDILTWILVMKRFMKHYQLKHFLYYQREYQFMQNKNRKWPKCHRLLFSFVEQQGCYYSPTLLNTLAVRWLTNLFPEFVSSSKWLGADVPQVFRY